MQQRELALLGRMVAEAAHDLNNVLAVTRDAGGLLRDILATVKPKKLPHPDKLARIVESIDRQTARGARTAKALNGLAHLADEPEATVDLATLVSLAAVLETRHASQNRVEVSALLLTPGVFVTAPPLRLMLALAGCLRACVDACHDGTVAVGCGRENGEAVVRFAMSRPVDPCVDEVSGVTDLGLRFLCEGGEAKLLLPAEQSTSPA